MSELLFRQEALDARARLDALPNAMRVTDSQTRTTVAVTTLALILSLIASAFVVIPIHVGGQGVLVDQSGELLVPVVAGADSTVEAVLVQPGDRVEAGQPIGRLYLPEFDTAIDKANRQITQLTNEFVSFDALERIEVEASKAVDAQKRAAIAERIQDLQARLEALDKREATDKQPGRRGPANDVRLSPAYAVGQELRQQLANARSDLAVLDSQQVEQRTKRRRDRLERLVRLDQARYDLASLQLGELARETLLSPVDGVVAELGASPGAVVKSGTQIVNLVASNNDGKAPLSAIVYVSLATGKQIKPGAEVLLAPASHSDDDHDRIRAHVVSVSETAVTAAALRRSLGNEQLVALATRNGPAFAVRVALDPNPASPSGYAWTSGTGPTMALTRGTPLGAEITVERRSLLSLAVPALKRLLGFAGDPMGAATE